MQRPLGKRRYRKLFVIAVEGAITERLYFGMLNRRQDSVIHLKCLHDKHKSAARQVLKRMQEYLKQNNLKDTDEAWLVVDKDSNSDDVLEALCRWAKGKPNYGFALSNPKFEYWLLLHFEDGGGVTSPQICGDRLKRYLPDYNKGINARDFTHERIEDAISRAKRRDNPPCDDWPRAPGGTTVYKLVENILRGSASAG
ncbi:MAG: RloB family protein [Kiritimatiellia bacterium]